MWSTVSQKKGKQDQKGKDDKEALRNVRYIHMQISTPKTGNKTRASKVKEALRPFLIVTGMQEQKHVFVTVFCKYHPLSGE